MDAAERVPLATGRRVCWLRLSDEHSGAVLATTVFPPGVLVLRRRAGRPGRAAAGLRPLGAAGGVTGRQRPSVGAAPGGPADGAGPVAGRARGGGAVQPAP